MVRRLRKAMVAAQDFWLSADEDLRLRAALASAILESPPDEADRIKRSVDAIKALASAMSGVPVDLERALDVADPLPLMKLWRAAVNPTAMTTAEEILEDAAADHPDAPYFAAAQRLVPAARSVDVRTHERVEAALKLARLAGIEAAATAIVGAADATEATVRLQALAEEPFPLREGRS